MSDEATSEVTGTEVSDSTETTEASQDAVSSTEDVSEVNDGTEDTQETESKDSEESTDESTEDVAAPEQFKLERNGQVYYKTMAELIKENQLAESSYEKFQDAAKERKEAESIRASLAKDPLGALIGSGLSEAEAKEILFANAITLMNEENLPEPEKQALVEQRKNEALEKELAAYKQAAEEQTTAAQQAKEEQAIQDEFMGVMKAENIPFTPHAVQRMASIIMAHESNNVSITAKDAAMIYRDEQTSGVQAYVKGLSGKQLTEIFGSDVADKIRKDSIAKLKNPAPTSNPGTETKAPPKEKESMTDFFQNLKT